ncbi:MAG TPA: CoA-binding protein [Peptococcaceae bacterium]|nr:CoA-binding protein [Peptococcaceae bacterium]
MSLEHLLKPKAIAILGANEDHRSFGNTAAINAIQSEKNTEVYFVNLKHEKVLGKPVYRTLSELPTVPDLILLATPKAAVPSLIEEAGKLGTKAAVVVASGYSEEGTETGRAAEAELASIAKKYDMKVMGPNCVGFINNIHKIKAMAYDGIEFDLGSRQTGAAIFTQSGKIATDMASCPYLDLSYVFSMGNCAMLTLEAMFEHVIEEKEVRLAGFYLEGVKDPPRFIRCLQRAFELRKPVVVHAAGLSKLGAKSAASHTGNLTGDRAVYEAIFKKYHVIMVENKDEFVSALSLLSCLEGRMPNRANFAGFNESGGDNAILADMCEKYGVRLPALQPTTIEKLKAALPRFASPANPLDAVGGSLTGAVKDQVPLYRILGQDPNIDAILMGTMPFALNDPLNDLIGGMMLQYAEEDDSVPMLVMPSMEDRRDPVWREKLRSRGIAILGCSDIGYNVLGKVSRSIEDGLPRTLESAVPDHWPTLATVSLTEFDSKQALSRVGLPMPKQAMARSIEELLLILEEIRYPLVMKISSSEIRHKTDAGGVQLNIGSREEALKAYPRILERCAAYAPKAKLEGVLVQEMAKPGLEIILGISNDARFGPLLMIGLGGIFVEIFKDIALYPCPLGYEEAKEMISSLKAFKLLTGYRGSKPLDLDALAKAMVRLSRFAAENKETVKELDLNPVFVYPEGEGLCVADALLIRYENQ